MNDAHLYDSGYFIERSYGADQRREASYRAERERIQERVKHGHILDVGCGTGVFLEGFDDRWKKYGVEPSEYAFRQSKARYIEMFPDLRDIADLSMDVVVFRGTLQHISTPIQDLYHAAGVLKPGGLLAILATPDADSLVYRIWGKLPALDAPRNWVIFGHRELENILKRLGFTDIEILHPYWDSPYARPFFDFWNFILSLLFGWRPFAFPGSMMEVYARKS